MVGHFLHVSEDLANRVARGLGFDKMPNVPKTATIVKDMPPSPALQTIGKMKDTLQGRSIGILIADGSDVNVINSLKQAVIRAGANVKIVGPKIGGAKLSDGSMLHVDGQLAGTPSTLFDAVAIILSPEGANALSMEAAAIDFVRDAYGHLKAIGADMGGEVIVKSANIKADAGVFNILKIEAFISAAKTRQWGREKSIRTLA
jgi:catalase